MILPIFSSSAKKAAIPPLKSNLNLKFQFEFGFNSNSISLKKSQTKIEFKFVSPLFLALRVEKPSGDSITPCMYISTFQPIHTFFSSQNSPYLNQEYLRFAQVFYWKFFHKSNFTPFLQFHTFISNHFQKFLSQLKCYRIIYVWFAQVSYWNFLYISKFHTFFTYFFFTMYEPPI